MLAESQPVGDAFYYLRRRRPVAPIRVQRRDIYPTLSVFLIPHQVINPRGVVDRICTHFFPLFLPLDCAGLALGGLPALPKESEDRSPPRTT